MKPKVFLLILFTCAIIETTGQNEKEKIEEEILIDPEKIASFPGGSDSLTSFINKNLVKPIKNKKKGKVYVAFFVNTDGSLTDLKIERGLTTECDMSALEAIQKMPKWIPGTMYSIPIRQRIVLPINFE